MEAMKTLCTLEPLMTDQMQVPFIYNNVIRLESYTLKYSVWSAWVPVKVSVLKLVLSFHTLFSVLLKELLEGDGCRAVGSSSLNAHRYPHPTPNTQGRHATCAARSLQCV